MKKLNLTLAVMALALSACAASPTKPVVSKSLEFSAWLVFWDSLSWKSFEANVARMARVYPEAYTCQADGLPGRIAIAKADDMAKTVALARQHGVKVLGTMNNYADGGFEPKRVQKFLHDPALMERHVDGLIKMAQEDKLDGLDVDYELLSAGVRQAFTAFVTRLGAKAHAQKLLVGIAVHPKDSEPGTWDGPQAQDYAALGRAVDYFHVMTYDNHWSSGQPGPVAPLPWVKSVMTFTVAQVPAAKVEMGLNGYGYNWTPKGETLTWPRYLSLTARVGAFERDAASGEMFKKYTGGEAWTSDAQASGAKFALARELGLGGVAMWVLGQEDPATWNVWDAAKGKK